MWAPISAAVGRQTDLSVGEKLRHLNWGMVLLVCAVGGVGFAMLYSAGNGRFDPWASRQIMRFAVGLTVMLAVAVIDLRFWLRHAYTIYAVTFALLIFVEVAGDIGMGARRWIDLGGFQLQPSEVMKVALVLALARYFHRLGAEEIGRPVRLAG